MKVLIDHEVALRAIAACLLVEGETLYRVVKRIETRRACAPRHPHAVKGPMVTLSEEHDYKCWGTCAGTIFRLKEERLSILEQLTRPNVG